MYRYGWVMNTPAPRWALFVNGRQENGANPAATAHKASAIKAGRTEYKLNSVYP